jgi:hypothetical protein
MAATAQPACDGEIARYVKLRTGTYGTRRFVSLPGAMGGKSGHAEQLLQRTWLGSSMARGLIPYRP